MDAGDTSAATDAALEAVRTYWIQSQLAGSGQGAGGGIAPATRPRPGTMAGSGAPRAASASLRSSSGTLAAVAACLRLPTIGAGSAGNTLQDGF